MLQSELKHKYIKSLKKIKNIDNILNKDIVTYDIETFKDKNNFFVPYSCGWYNGKVSKTYYLSDFNSVDQLIITSIKDMINNNKNSIVYVHNLSKFYYILINKIIY